MVGLLVRAGIVPEGERAERCLANGCGGYLSMEEATLAAAHAQELLTRLAPAERMRADATATASERRTHNTPVTEWNDDDVREIYAVGREWLADFSDFCRRSGGFTVL